MTEEGPLLGLQPIGRRAEHARAAPGRGRGPGRGTTYRIRCTSTFLTPPPRGPADDTPLAAAVALSAELMPEPRAVAAPLGPATGEEGLVRGDIAGLLRLAVRRRAA